MSSDYLSEYKPPTPQQLANLEESEGLYIAIEAFIRKKLPPGMMRQQALFRLQESKM